MSHTTWTAEELVKNGSGVLTSRAAGCDGAAGESNQRPTGLQASAACLRTARSDGDAARKVAAVPRALRRSSQESVLHIELFHSLCRERLVHIKSC